MKAAILEIAPEIFRQMFQIPKEASSAAEVAERLGVSRQHVYRVAG